MATKTRSQLKLYFVNNAIPTEDSFADLIDSQLNQSDDGVFKPAGQPLALVAPNEEPRRVLQLYGAYPAENPDWAISLNPRDPDDPAATAPGFGIADGAGETRLVLDPAGNLRTTGSVTAGGDLAYGGLLSKLDVKETFTATVRAAEFKFGHSGQRGSPGRALADGNDALVVNQARDWTQVTIQSPLRVEGKLEAPSGIVVDGTTEQHIDADGSFYRHQDGQVYLTVDDNLYIRDKDASTWASRFNTHNGDLHLKGRLYDKTGDVMPAGAIIMWRGSLIPEGWALCDGTNGTPDLRGRFVLGSGQGSGLTNRALNTTGGTERVQLTIAEMPSHNHANGAYDRLLSFTGTWTHTSTDNSSTEPNIHTSGVIQPAGGNVPHENMPPFYVLAFIMKL